MVGTKLTFAKCGGDMSHLNHAQMTGVWIYPLLHNLASFFVRQAWTTSPLLHYSILRTLIKNRCETRGMWSLVFGDFSCSGNDLTQPISSQLKSDIVLTILERYRQVAKVFSWICSLLEWQTRHAYEWHTLTLYNQINRNGVMTYN